MTKLGSWTELLKARDRLKRVVRLFFDDYLEIDTPVVVPCPGVEPHLRYVRTHWPDGWEGDSHQGKPASSLWLRSSPELACKQLMTMAGVDKLFELGPCFRSGRGEFSPWHHPEFWLLEWYRRPCTFSAMLSETEELLEYCFRECSPHAEQLSFVRLSVYECFAEFMGITLVDEDEDLAQQLIEAGLYSVNHHDDFETAFFKALLEVCEPRFKTMSAVVLYDYPPSQGVLAQCAGGRAQRAETYIHGVEITNGCMEMYLKSAHLAYQAQTGARRQALGYEVPMFDAAFLDSVEAMIGATAGVACGFERLFALIHQRPSIAAHIPFRQIYEPLFKSGGRQAESSEP